MWKKKATARHVYNTEKVFLAATQPLNAVWSYFGTTKRGLLADEVEERQKKYGKNEVEHERKKSAAELFITAFINPFIGILTVLMLISLVLDVILAEPEDKDWTTIIIIGTMVVFSAILRFVQEWKANTASEALLRMVAINKNSPLVSTVQEIY